MVTIHQSLRLVAGVIAGLLTVHLSGCALLDAPPSASSQGSALAWLTQWVSQPLDVAPGFDLEALRPEPRQPVVAPEDLLEVTVWDLYEPGKPYTFPVRVSAKQTIEAPFLSEYPVADRTPAQMEASLGESYRAGEFLVHPRVLVRSLDPPTVKVQVGGAVQRTGFVELSRTDASVYAALISAGGLKKTAGTQVGLLRRSHAAENTAAGDALHQNTSEPAPNDPPSTSTRTEHPQQLANSLEILSVEAGRPPHAESTTIVKTTEGQPHASEGSGLPTTSAHVDQTRPVQSAIPSPTWYDLSRPEDRQSLRLVQLAEGDEVIVKAATLPIRIGGVVQRPGAYPLPTGRTLNVWQALELAGGIRTHDVPLNFTLIRQAAEGRLAQRWVLHVADYDEHPAASPPVEPGDVLHVEPTTGGKLKRAVGDLWNKP
jgi:protein involved in polysaccharide export with SLBB domain